MTSCVALQAYHHIAWGPGVVVLHIAEEAGVAYSAYGNGIDRRPQEPLLRTLGSSHLVAIQEDTFPLSSDCFVRNLECKAH